MLIVSLLTIITQDANFVNRQNKNLNSFEFSFFSYYSSTSSDLNAISDIGEVWIVNLDFALPVTVIS